MAQNTEYSSLMRDLVTQAKSRIVTEVFVVPPVPPIPARAKALNAAIRKLELRRKELSKELRELGYYAGSGSEAPYRSEPHGDKERRDWTAKKNLRIAALGKLETDTRLELLGKDSPDLKAILVAFQKKLQAI